MAIIAHCEKGLVIDLFTNNQMVYPSEAYAHSENVIFSYWDKMLKFYNINERKTIKEYCIEDCKQMQISECGCFGGALTFKKNLFVYSHTAHLFSYDNVASFSMSSSLLSFSRGSELFIYKITGSKIRKIENVFYFKVFGEYIILVQRIKDTNFGFSLSIYREDVIADFKLEQIEKMETKSDGKGSFLFLVTSKYTSSSYYGHDHLYFFNIDGLSFKEVDVLDPPLFFSFLKSKFVVCSGNQPSFVSIYDYQCSVVKSFPKGVRNRVFFNAHYNLVAFCGFENLSGNIEIYDVQTSKIITRLKILGASLFSWSPDGSYFIISITNYMKEDNSIEMYDYYGTRINRAEFANLIKSEWIGEKEGFRRLEKPEKLKLEEETVYVLPSFEHLKARCISRKKNNQALQKQKASKEPVLENTERRDADEIKKELEVIQSIKEKQERGLSLSVAELNKLLKESSLINELGSFKTN